MSIPSPGPRLHELRLAAHAALTAIGCAAVFGLGLRGPWTPLLLAGAAAWISVGLGWLPALRNRPGALHGFLLFDALTLTLVLALTGGPANPFTALYVLIVVVAALSARPWFAYAMVGWTSLAFALLFVWSMPLRRDGGAALAPCCETGQDGLSFHLYGMWGAHVLVSGVAAAFVSRLAAQRDLAMSAAQAQQDRAARYGSVAALAAGAAHEIATPLATIQTAAGEIVRLAEGEAAAEAEEIRRQTLRCRAILDAMNPETLAGACDPAAVAARVAAHAGPEVVAEASAHPAAAALSEAGLARVLDNLVRNARAAAPGRPVRLSAAVEDGAWVVRVVDQGAAPAPEVLAGLGRPFHSTKPGGMGLGLFVSRLICEQAGGSLALSAAAGGGVCAAVRLPLAPDGGGRA